MEDVFIGFRATRWPLLLNFLKALDDLGVDKSELAKRAIEHGLQGAIRELEKETAEREKREKQIENLLKPHHSNAGRLSSLFSFAERRGWVGRNPMKLLETVRLDSKPPMILTPEQAAKVMEWAMYRRPRSLAFFALALFAGVRPEELEKVSWANVRDCVLTVDAAASKIRRRRIVRLNETANEWVCFARETGAALPYSRSAWSRTRRIAARHLGFKGWPHDILRHSSASYMLASSRDVGAIAKSLGNSPSILLNHYYELVTSESAHQFWSILP